MMYAELCRQSGARRVISISRCYLPALNLSQLPDPPQLCRPYTIAGYLPESTPQMLPFSVTSHTWTCEAPATVFEVQDLLRALEKAPEHQTTILQRFVPSPSCKAEVRNDRGVGRGIFWAKGEREESIIHVRADGRNLTHLAQVLRIAYREGHTWGEGGERYGMWLMSSRKGYFDPSCNDWAAGHRVMINTEEVEAYKFSEVCRITSKSPRAGPEDVRWTKGWHTQGVGYGFVTRSGLVNQERIDAGQTQPQPPHRIHPQHTFVQCSSGRTVSN